MEAELVPPSRLRHGVPEDLETICLKCLDRDPARRYATRGGPGRRPEAVPGEPADPGRRTSRLRQMLQWTRRQPDVARLIGLCALLVFALLSVVAGYNLYLTEQNRLSEAAWSRAIELKNRIAIDRDKFSGEVSTARDAGTGEAISDQAKHQCRSDRGSAQESCRSIVDDFALDSQGPAGLRVAVPEPVTRRSRAVVARAVVARVPPRVAVVARRVSRSRLAGASSWLARSWLAQWRLAWASGGDPA